MPKHILRSMMLVADLKETPRTGWNLEFPRSATLTTRRVDGAESVADHKTGLSFLFTLCAHELQLSDADTLRGYRMIQAHDVAELETGDIVTAVLSGEELERVLRQKEIAERRAMLRIKRSFGPVGSEFFDLWAEYSAKQTPLAKLIGQLDKLEATYQALAYEKAGHQVDAMEFVNFTRTKLKDPFLIELLNQIEQEVTKLRASRRQLNRQPALYHVTIVVIGFVALMTALLLTR